jgi:hypothetical protein
MYDFPVTPIFVLDYLTGGELVIEGCAKTNFL